MATWKFTPTQDFRDGYTTYKQGREYEAESGEVVYFVRNSWATSPDYDPTPPPAALPKNTTLQVANVEVGGSADNVEAR